MSTEATSEVGVSLDLVGTEETDEVFSSLAGLIKDPTESPETDSSEGPPAAEATAKDAEASQEVSSEENPSEDEEDLLDSLSKDKEESEGEGWDGKTPLNKHPRFKKLIEQRNEEREARQAAETKLLEAQALQKEFTDKYSQFDDPANQFQLDTQFIEAMNTLYEREVPAIQDAREAVSEFLRTGKVPTMSDEKTATNKMVTPKTDTRLDVILSERLESTVDNLLEGTRIRPELHGVIKDAVIGKLETTASKSAVRDAVKDYIESSGWSQDFLIGQSPSKASAQSKPPTPGSQKMTVKAQETESEKKQEDNPADYREELQTKLRSLVAGAQ